MIVLADQKVFQDTYKNLKSKYRMFGPTTKRVMIREFGDKHVWMAYKTDPDHPINVTASRILIDLSKVAPVQGAKTPTRILSCLPTNLAVIYSTEPGDSNKIKDYSFSSVLHEWTEFFVSDRIAIYKRVAALYSTQAATSKLTPPKPYFTLFHDICDDHSRLDKDAIAVDYIWDMIFRHSTRRYVDFDNRRYIIHCLYLACILANMHTFKWSTAQYYPVYQG